VKSTSINLSNKTAFKKKSLFLSILLFRYNSNSSFVNSAVGKPKTWPKNSICVNFSSSCRYSILLNIRVGVSASRFVKRKSPYLRSKYITGKSPASYLENFLIISNLSSFPTFVLDCLSNSSNHIFTSPLLKFLHNCCWKSVLKRKDLLRTNLNFPFLSLTSKKLT
jgi:hypothetical protein